MTLDDLLLEISYKLPKGYPTIVNGKFVDREEVLLINEFLIEHGIGELPLPEAKPVRQEAAQTGDDIDKVHNAILALPAMKQHVSATATAITKTKTTPKYTEWRVELPGKDERVQKAAAVQKGLSSKTLTDRFKKPSKVYIKKDKYIFFNIDGYEYRYYLKKVESESKTSTDVKEGMSVILSQYNESVEDLTKVISFVTATNLTDAITYLLSFVDKGKVVGLSKDTVDDCVAFLNLAAKSKNPKTIKEVIEFINQNISHSSTFNDFFNQNQDYVIDRDVLFNSIRDAGSKIANMKPDKWCPGDVYFVNKKSIGDINKTLLDAKKIAQNNKDQAIGMLNALFSDKYYQPADAPIVAVSLKMQDAQAGKLKSGFEEYADTPTNYSLTSEELAYKLADYRNGCLEYQKIFSEELSKADVDIDWQFCDVSKIKDIRILKFKYAAYKALYFILTKVADNKIKNFDDALVSLVAFGLGVIKKAKGFKTSTKINPPFFKVIANKSANSTKPILFKGGGRLALINVDGTSDNLKITIVDRPTYKGVQVLMGLLVGSNKFDISIRINSNGNTQVNVELEKANHID